MEQRSLMKSGLWRFSLNGDGADVRGKSVTPAHPSTAINQVAGHDVPGFRFGQVDERQTAACIKRHVPTNASYHVATRWRDVHEVVPYTPNGYVPLRLPVQTEQSK